MLVSFFLPILLLKANLVVVAQVQAGSLSISQRIMGKKGSISKLSNPNSTEIFIISTNPQ